MSLGLCFKKINAKVQYFVIIFQCFLYIYIDNLNEKLQMITTTYKTIAKTTLLLFFLIFSHKAMAQDDTGFWSRVRFGGAVGVAFGNNYTNVSLAPSAIYEFNRYVGLGVGLQGTYIKDRNFNTTYKSYLYGGSLIGVFNPIEQVQLSAELEQLRVNLDIEDYYRGQIEDNFWNTALFLGAGYRAGNVIIGIRYNVLFDDDDFVYSTSYMPFVRLYF